MSEPEKVQVNAKPSEGAAKEAAKDKGGKERGDKKDKPSADDGKKDGGKNKPAVNLGPAWLMPALVVAAILLLPAAKGAWDFFHGAATETDRVVAAREEAARERKRADDAERAKAEAERIASGVASDDLGLDLRNQISKIREHEDGEVGIKLEVTARKPGKQTAAREETAREKKRADDAERAMAEANRTAAAEKAASGSALRALSWDVLMDENIKRIAKAHGIDPDSMKPSDITVLRLAKQQEEFVRSTEAKTEALKAEVQASRNKVNELQTQLEAARLTKAKAGDGRLERLEAAVEEARKEAEQLKAKLDASEATRAKLEATLKAATPPAPGPN